MSTTRSFTPRQAIERLRELVLSGDFAPFVTVDRQSGELAQNEARSLFAALPSVTPATTPEELIDHGLIGALPRELRRAVEAPRYKKGREVFVRTTVQHHNLVPHKPAGSFVANGKDAFTHLATLIAQRGEDFLVRIPGTTELLPFSKSSVFTWNEPATLPAQGASLSGVSIDYNDPLLKAHIVAALISIAPDLAALDFSTDTLAAQKKLVHQVASRVKMTFPGRGEGYSGTRAGALLVGGQGVSFVQRAVAAALLFPFTRVLAFDIQVATGRTLRLSAPHGFLVVTLRPSMARFVVDPSWGEPLTDLRVAFFDAAWGHDRRLTGFEGTQDVRVRPDLIDLPYAEDAA